MSGGSMDYLYGRIEDHADELEDKELSDLARDLATVFHDAEWYHSGDTCQGTYRESVQKFKEKWFNTPRIERLDKYAEEIKNKAVTEILELYGNYKTCNKCLHWKDKEQYAQYGSCDLHEHCLWHRSDLCDQYDPKK